MISRLENLPRLKSLQSDDQEATPVPKGFVDFGVNQKIDNCLCRSSNANFFKAEEIRGAIGLRKNWIYHIYAQQLRPLVIQPGGLLGHGGGVLAEGVPGFAACWVRRPRGTQVSRDSRRV